MERITNITRDTKETQISLELNIDGEGNSSIDTGIGFFNHMLEAFTKHGLFDMNCKCDGDIEVDGHHTVEDTGMGLTDVDNGEPHIALDNVKERLKLFVGGTLSISPREGGGTIVTIFIPNSH